MHSFPDATTLAQYGGKGPFDAGTDKGRLQNVGYQQSLYNLGNLKAAGLSSPMVWIDVEPVPTFVWSADKAANAAVIAGAARGYTDNGFQIGVYSTPALYEGVVGDLSLGGIPEWRAAGQTSQAEALSRCGDDWSDPGRRRRARPVGAVRARPEHHVPWRREAAVPVLPPVLTRVCGGSRATR